MELHVGIDVGGTFTDIALSVPERNAVYLHKLPSTPEEPDRAIIEGLRHALASNALAPADVERLSHGTTVGTNALIQRQVGTVGVVTTQGFRDLLEIGRQTRPRVYDIHLDHPKPLVPRELRLEVEERILADGTVHRELSASGLRDTARELESAGVDSVVVCFLNAYAHPAHETQAASTLRELLPKSVSIVASADIYPEFREYERFSTAVLNAALFTVMNAYLDRFGGGAAALGVPTPPTVSQSVGGLMSIAMARRIPLKASLSGPAAGVVGASARALAAGIGNLITLDMGGTSADVSLLVDGRAAEVQERLLAGFPLRMPAIDVNAVGAGGGSIAWIDRDGLLKVGPQSAGAEPGPACYGLGGEAATVTDANVVLGRLNGDALLDGTMPIRKALATASVERLAHQLGLDLHQTALGILQVTAAVMVKAIRAISVERGHDPSTFSLFAFGGAGPLHAAEVARELDIHKVIIPPSPGILCAEGLLHSDLRADFVSTVLQPLDARGLDAFKSAHGFVSEQGQSWFDDEGIETQDRLVDWSVDLRYFGQNFELTLPLGLRQITTAALAALSSAFHAAHEVAYGFASPSEPIELVSVRVKVTGRLTKPAIPTLSPASPGTVSGTRRTLLVDGSGHAWHDAPIYRREVLALGQQISGPAIIEQLDATVLVHPSDTAVVDSWGNLLIELAAL